MTRRPCSSSTSTWWITNLRTSRVAKDPLRHEIWFVTFTRERVFPTSSLFATNSSYAKCKKTMTCWITLTRSRRLWIISLSWRNLRKMKTSSWFRQLLVDVEYVQEGWTSIKCDNQATTFVENLTTNLAPNILM